VENRAPLRDPALVYPTASDSKGLELPAATSSDRGKRG